MSERILVVDDSPTIRRVVSNILEAKGFSTLQAGNGEEALEELTKSPVDLVLLDFVMPKMNGYQFCREIRARQQYRGLPVVLMSAKGDKIRGQFVKQTGAIDAITKPFDPKALLAVIEGALRKPTRAAMPSSFEEDDDVGVVDFSDLELSDEPGMRRAQVATAFAEGIARLIGPAVRRVDPQEQAELEGACRHVITAERLGAFAGLMKLLEASKEGEPVLSGDLTFISIAEVLQMLELQRQTGTMTIATQEAQVSLYLSEGKLDLAQGHGLPTGFRLGRFLVEDGVITRAQLRNFLNNRASTQRLIGDALIQLEQATEEQVQQALERQTSELVYEAVRWNSGRFTFVSEATCPEATLARLALTPGALLMEAFRRVDEWRLIEGSFDFDEVLHRDEAGPESTAELTSQERTVLEAIDGKRSVRQIVDDVEASTFDVCKILYQFLNSRIVRRKAA